MTGKRVFVIGLSKNWVEIRAHHKPPRKMVSEAEKSYKYKQRFHQYGYFDRNGRYYPSRDNETHSGKLKISCTNYMGGKVLTTMKTRKFRSLTGVTISNGAMIELTQDAWTDLANKVTACLKEQ